MIIDRLFPHIKKVITKQSNHFFLYIVICVYRNVKMYTYNDNNLQYSTVAIIFIG